MIYNYTISPCSYDEELAQQDIADRDLKSRTSQGGVGRGIKDKPKLTTWK